MIFLEILTLFTIGLSLSIDTFVLSTVYGLINYSNKKIYAVFYNGVDLNLNELKYIIVEYNPDTKEFSNLVNITK